MRIELNAGGLNSCLTSVGNYHTDIKSAYNAVDKVLDAFHTVEQSTYKLNGGVGNLQDALEAVQARIKTEQQKLENIEQVQKTTNDFLSLALSIDARVASQIDKRKNDFYGQYPWAKPPKEKSTTEKILDDIILLYETFKDLASQIKAKLDEIKDKLVEWYETSGAKEILNIIISVRKVLVSLVALVASAFVTIDSGGTLGATFFLSVAALAISVEDLRVDIPNELKAWSLKRQALEEEKNGNTSFASQLRAEATRLSDESSWAEHWWNDDTFNAFDILGCVFECVQLADAIVSFTNLIGDIGDAGGISKFISNGFSKTGMEFVKFLFDDLAGNAINAIEWITDGVISLDNDGLGFNVKALNPFDSEIVNVKFNIDAIINSFIMPSIFIKPLVTVS